MLKLGKLKKDENGNGLLICFIVIFIMFGIAGLVIDASILYKAKGEMKKAANAAALSGAQMIFSSDDYAVGNTVDYILKAHDEDDCTKVITKKTDTVTVNLTKKVSLYFMRIFGVNTATLNVESCAKIGNLGVGFGATPIGIPDTVDVSGLTDLSLSPGNSNSGNFNFLDFSQIYYQGNHIVDSYGETNPGKPTVNHYLENGFAGHIGLNYTIATETGVGTGKVSEAIDYRMIHDRIFLIILYKDGTEINGKDTIIVTGFAYFYLEGYSDHSIKGKFINYVSPDSIDDTAKDQGAYGEKLIE